MYSNTQKSRPQEPRQAYVSITQINELPGDCIRISSSVKVLVFEGFRSSTPNLRVVGR